MSTWDSIIFSSDAVTDLLEEVSVLEDDDLSGALLDACRLAAGDADDDEARAGLGAATVAAIWSGAPFSAGQLSTSTRSFARASARVRRSCARRRPRRSTFWSPVCPKTSRRPSRISPRPSTSLVSIACCAA